MKVLEINDLGLRVSDENGVLAISPGFACLNGKSLELGETAQRRSRIDPTNSYNDFWHRLSMDPLAHGTDQVRHFADIAYAHLLHLGELTDLDDELILAVPGNFTAEQLAILLGLTAHCPFTVVGIVDSALVAVMPRAERPTIVYVELQLHQVVLTRLRVENNNGESRLNKDSVIQVPGVGAQSFMELMMRIITGLFVQQCRFNPQHNAESEQQLYDALPNWLNQNDRDENSLLLELKSATVVHQVKMPKQNLIEGLQGYYQKILRQISALVSANGSQILLSHDIANLPGFMSLLQQDCAANDSVEIVDNSVLSDSCLAEQDQLRGSEHGVYKVESLALTGTAETEGKSYAGINSAKANTLGVIESLPSHVLIASRALPIGRVEIRNNSGNSRAQTTVQIVNKNIELCITGLPDNLAYIEKQQDAVYLVCDGMGSANNIMINGSRISGNRQLLLGDKLEFVSPNGD
ncbi:MAG: hypothetical protein COC19_02450 [SAR86 cluster bacterium]|uniref:FHA domain-containing protein n=1 Tax=SAR86 cluster bacterium TaxID=2030880 RepID=A0A2A4MRZ8_9GAMM|nr:MAG: hypothetical protein COC19_02450 [SAR86 cluster bacterium]